MRTMISLENTYFSMAAKSGANTLIICDRGVMDASAFVDRAQWANLVAKIGLEEEDVCEKRYDHVVHMVSTFALAKSTRGLDIF